MTLSSHSQGVQLCLHQSPLYLMLNGRGGETEEERPLRETRSRYNLAVTRLDVMGPEIYKQRHTMLNDNNQKPLHQS